MGKTPNRVVDLTAYRESCRGSAEGALVDGRLQTARLEARREQLQLEMAALRGITKG